MITKTYRLRISLSLQNFSMSPSFCFNCWGVCEVHSEEVLDLHHACSSEYSLQESYLHHLYLSVTSRTTPMIASEPWLEHLISPLRASPESVIKSWGLILACSDFVCDRCHAAWTNERADVTTKDVGGASPKVS
jgi:hypothetical protein